jgi:hypothetical protein
MIYTGHQIPVPLRSPEAPVKLGVTREGKPASSKAAHYKNQVKQPMQYLFYMKLNQIRDTRTLQSWHSERGSYIYAFHFFSFTEFTGVWFSNN